MLDKILIYNREVDAASLVVEGVDPRDYPDLVDSYFAEGFYVDGGELGDEDLELLQNQESSLLYERAYESLF